MHSEKYNFAIFLKINLFGTTFFLIIGKEGNHPENSFWTILSLIGIGFEKWMPMYQKEYTS